MSYKLIIRPFAYTDLEEIIKWYNKKQSGLGNRFYKEIQSSLDSILDNPFAYAVRYKNIRTKKHINFHT